jgi:NAD(P)-dependent dehydrogenase (short-subunit alcohol dehydrogenase family)
MTKHDFKGSEEREKYLSSGNMLGRLSEPKEYRGAAVFMVSEASSFVTGANLVVDGGHMSW